MSNQEHADTREPGFPADNRTAFEAAALANMERYGNLPYELGGLVVGHVVDAESTHMAFQVRPEYIDDGSMAVGFRVHESQDSPADVLTAARVSPASQDNEFSKHMSRRATGDRVEALRRAQGVKGHVQLKAADIEHGLVVTTTAPGNKIEQYDEPVRPTEQQWKDLSETAKAMRRKRIGYDAVGNNVHWDPVEGFTIFDSYTVGFNPKRWVRPRKLVQSVRNKVEAQTARTDPTQQTDRI